jgi:hypothetical protein
MVLKFQGTMAAVVLKIGYRGVYGLSPNRVRPVLSPNRAIYMLGCLRAITAARNSTSCAHLQFHPPNNDDGFVSPTTTGLENFVSRLL